MPSSSHAELAFMFSHRLERLENRRIFVERIHMIISSRFEIAGVRKGKGKEKFRFSSVNFSHRADPLVFLFPLLCLAQPTDLCLRYRNNNARRLYRNDEVMKRARAMYVGSAAPFSRSDLSPLGRRERERHAEEEET